jgi:hypothetical protein
MRCTEATLRALGVIGKSPQYGAGVLQALSEHGYRLQHLTTDTVGLRTFMAGHPTGRYYLASAGHAMALVDGVLTDTSERAISDRIKVWAAVQILP